MCKNTLLSSDHHDTIELIYIKTRTDFLATIEMLESCFPSLFLKLYVKIFLMGYHIRAFCVGIKNKNIQFIIHFDVIIYRIRLIVAEKKLILISYMAQTITHKH